MTAYTVRGYRFTGEGGNETAVMHKVTVDDEYPTGEPTGLISEIVPREPLAGVLLAGVGQPYLLTPVGPEVILSLDTLEGCAASISAALRQVELVDGVFPVLLDALPPGVTA